MVPVAGGTIYPVEVRDGVVRAALEGPDDPLLKGPEKVRADLVAHIDPSHTFAKIVVGGEERLLRVGEWSDWVPVQFALAWGAIHAECRFYLKQLHPEFVLYVSPLNLDPLAPALPVSSPGAYAADLARATGRFYTQGMPEDTKALRTGVLTASEFLQQARIAAAENERQYRLRAGSGHRRVPVLLLRQRRPGVTHDVASHGSAASRLRSGGRSAIQPDRGEPVRRDGRHRRPDASAARRRRSPRHHVGPWVRLVAPRVQPEHLAARQRLSHAEAGSQGGRRRVVRGHRLEGARVRTAWD